MRVRVLISVLLLAAVVAAQTAPAVLTPQKRRSARSAASKPALAGDASSGAQLQQRLRDILNAWSTMDPASAEPYYAKDADLVFFDLAPLQYKGWDEYYLGARKLFSNYQSLSLRLNEDARVHWKGDTAWATATWNVQATFVDGAKQDLDLRWTVVLERRGGEWLVVHEHVSAPLPPAQKAQKKIP